MFPRTGTATLVRNGVWHQFTVTEKESRAFYEQLFGHGLIPITLCWPSFDLDIDYHWHNKASAFVQGF